MVALGDSLAGASETYGNNTERIMARPDNPRYPHSCVIWRQTTENPMVDEDMEYDPLNDDLSSDEPLEEDIPLVKGGVRGETSSEVQKESPEKQIIYQGECRAYDKNTVSDKGEVITSYRGLAIPVTREGWVKLGVCPVEGDSIVVDRGASKEYGTVIDKNPGNFGGTHLIWRYGRD